MKGYKINKAQLFLRLMGLASMGYMVSFGGVLAWIGVLGAYWYGWMDANWLFEKRILRGDKLLLKHKSIKKKRTVRKKV